MDEQKNSLDTTKEILYPESNDSHESVKGTFLSEVKIFIKKYAPSALLGTAIAAPIGAVVGILWKCCSGNKAGSTLLKK